MFDIVAANKDELAATVDGSGVDHCQPRNTAPPKAAERPGGITAGNPIKPRDQPEDGRDGHHDL